MDLNLIKGAVLRNLDIDTLMKKAVERDEGKISKKGALTVTTGKYTGRSPNDRFIVDSPGIHDEINWGNVNMPISEEHFNKLYDKITNYIKERDEVYAFDGFEGADPENAHPVRVINEFAYENLFITHLLRRPTEEQLKDLKPEITVIAAPGCIANPDTDGTNSEAFVILNLEKKIIIIGGTKYCGEQKKSVFSYMNYIMPKKGIFPMHCSANKDNGNVAIFFGLSGTGKTTLSTDPKRKLIGDDEHGWSSKGIFNFEGGCYAKCINLTRESEPEIYDAIKHGAVVENVVMKEEGEYDFDDASLTENTRVAYPLEYIQNVDPAGIGGHPKTVIFLTADASGVMPPISKLNHEQAMYHFMSGYTSKLAGTERGVKEPQATFSEFFGAPFMPLKPMIYADLLKEFINKYDTKVFLINTGWSGGPYGIGKRISLKYTRTMVNAAINGELEKVEYQHHDIFNIDMPKTCPNVPDEILNPENTWDDKDAYQQKARELANLFKENFKKFKDIPQNIIDAGPK